MQQLYFHPAWEKTISEQDRQLIETLFDTTYTQVDDVMMSPVLRVAFNHQQQLLVTALVHNFTHHSTTFSERLVAIRCDLYVEEQVMTIPQLTIAPFTSMPWTFMFPANELHNQLDIGKLILDID